MIKPLRCNRFVAFLAIIPLLAVDHCRSAEPSATRPNILFIMSDDHAAAALSAYGGFLAEAAPTPNLDRLAREGMLFRNAFVTNSICTPSRAVLFTGLYSHRNGVYKFTPLDQSQPTVPKLLQKAGYHTAFVGKYHLHSNPVGLDDWSVLPGQGKYMNTEFVEMGDEDSSGRVAKGRKTAYQGHSSDLITDKALDFLKNRRPQDKPFCLFYHFKAPHDPFTYAPRYEELFADVQMPEPETLMDDYATRSDALKQTLQYVGSRWGHHTDYVKQTKHLEGEAKKKAQYQLYIKSYLRCVRGIDDNVGRMLKYLDESGLADSTIVIYTADQGFFLGEHGLYDKRFIYEPALRIPLLVRWPGKVKPGSENDDITLNLDFAPTLLDIAGTDVPVAMQGRSMQPLLAGSTPGDWRESLYYRYYHSHFKTEPHYGVRTRTHKLVDYHRLGQQELFDLTKDPQEVNNLIDDANYQDIRESLTREMHRLRKHYGDRLDDHGDHPRDGF